MSRRWACSSRKAFAASREGKGGRAPSSCPWPNRRPKDWRDSVAVEEARVRFIRRYRELRPHATLQRFAIYEALQFALRAMATMWGSKPGWHRVAETYLVFGFERLKSRLPE